MSWRLLAVLAPAVLAVSACSEPCKRDSDCSFGSFCQHDFYSDEIIPEGECVRECERREDCPAIDLEPGTFPICTNDGRCATSVMPDLLRLFDPENDTVYPDGTKTVRISGEIRTAADSVGLNVSIDTQNGCGGQREISRMVVKNPTPDRMVKIPFLIDDIPVDPGRSVITVRGDTSLAESATVDVDCPGCPPISINPLSASVVGELRLPELRGSVPAEVDFGIWRIHGGEGEVLDGSFEIEGGSFRLKDLPLFSGVNRVELLASQSSGNQPWGRCSSWVTSAAPPESGGLRVIAQWDDREAELAVQIVGPGGRYARPLLNIQRGTLIESARVDQARDGVYGVIVEPIHGEADARLRVLYSGRSLKRGPIGPSYVRATRGELWIAGTIEVREGSATWTPIDRVVFDPPPDEPEAWMPR